MRVSILSIITISIIVILVIIFLFCILKVINGNYRNNFTDITDGTNSTNGTNITVASIPTTTFDMSKVNTMTSNISSLSSSCENGTDIQSVCMNFDNCCSSNNITNVNGQCFCIHPFVKDCNDKYKTCIDSKNGNIEECNTIMKNCCKQYSSNDILSSNFQYPINATQMSNKLCSLNGILNLEERCMELCQTNSNCKAYSTTTGNCTLYDNVNYIDSNDDKNIYVIKKKK